MYNSLHLILRFSLGHFPPASGDFHHHFELHSEVIKGGKGDLLQTGHVTDNTEFFLCPFHNYLQQLLLTDPEQSAPTFICTQNIYITFTIRSRSEENVLDVALTQTILKYDSSYHWSSNCPVLSEILLFLQSRQPITSLGSLGMEIKWLFKRKNAHVQIVSAQLSGWWFSWQQFSFFKLGWKSFSLKWRGQCISCAQDFFFSLMGAQVWHGDYSSASGKEPGVFSQLSLVHWTISPFCRALLSGYQTCTFYALPVCTAMNFYTLCKVGENFAGRTCLGKLRLLTLQLLRSRVQPTVTWCCSGWWDLGNQVLLLLFLCIIDIC